MNENGVNTHIPLTLCELPADWSHECGYTFLNQSETLLDAVV